MSKYHDILGISEDATPKEIKKAYHRLAKKYHPDLNPNDSQAKDMFIKITEAYNMLLDPQKQRKTRLYRRRTITEEDLRNAARERAKAYAQMRYAEFLKQCKAYEATPMHKILWPKWVNFIIIAVAMVFVADSFLPRQKVQCKLSTQNEYRYFACGHSFIKSNQHAQSEINGMEAILVCTPIMGFVTKYRITDDDYIGLRDYFKPERREVDYFFVPVVIIILAIVVLVNKVKKFENKLLYKTIIILCTFAYGLMILGAFL